MKLPHKFTKPKSWNVLLFLAVEEKWRICQFGPWIVLLII